MITPDYARLMARYDRWQNGALIAAADRLDDAARWQDRGAFFRSIAETLNHILWDHRVWLARQQGDTDAARALNQRHPYTDGPRDWATYKDARAALDDGIRSWVSGLTATDIARDVTWQRGPETVETPFALNLIHMFNHATHHRGQVHAMLTAAGVDPGATDLPMLPDEV
ncbi:DinB family protein [Dinoroseobacter sp. S124A]|uniref:DinB family protein n=1 Tax=Dinoroseobacter sp. S124A TaxID=3415128 RepID=UPI003C7B9245